MDSSELLLQYQTIKTAKNYFSLKPITETKIMTIAELTKALISQPCNCCNLKIGLEDFKK
jgi:hypothetical protein